MMTLLAPLGLAAISAVAVPLAIHRIRRSDRHLVSFAAMRYLREHPHSREKFRLHERLLLLLRIVLIASLGFLLAVPVWRERSAPQTPWVLVAPGIDAVQARANVAAPLAIWRWLAPGLPALATPGPPARAPVPPTATASLTSLLREADASLTPGTALTVVVPTELGGLDAERLSLSRPITWRVLPGRGPEVAPTAQPTLTLAARYDPNDQTELPAVRALAAAWQADGMTLRIDIAARDAPLPPLPAWLIWLGRDLPPAVVDFARRGGSVLASRRTSGGQSVLADAQGAPVLRRQLIGVGRLLTLAAPLRATDVPPLATPEFPKTLAGLLRSPASAPDRAPAVSVAPVTVSTSSTVWGAAQSLAPPVSIAIALLYLLERVYASRKRPSAKTQA